MARALWHDLARPSLYTCDRCGFGTNAIVAMVDHRHSIGADRRPFPVRGERLASLARAGR